MNSRWQANKFGLINFWYYDEQEFSFVKGRMLLRGSNGSGKSVTMQSVAPLLLDGNMSPERLDPFGSRDRKMSSYLLEENDSREERTGYLYLEFKRQESETYLTVGMGIRARRGKPLDKWYFGLSDGRRIGKDFFLYKETDEKITLSKKELENRIQDGGQVFERQADYMEYVNRQIFGFDTLEEYKELLDLLIQLRTPKLSKDFKPSVVNEILSDSLQPLSDEDLRPLAEAIENMDTMNMNLKARREGRAAAEKISRVLDKYNRLILFEKASAWEEFQKKLELLEKEDQERKETIADCQQRAAALEQQQLLLNAKKEAMEKERESLNQSDAVGLKTRELDLGSRIKAGKTLLKEKEAQLESKKDQYIQTEAKEKEERDRQYQKEQELKRLLEEMQDEAGEMGFEEHEFFSAELLDRFGEPFSFDGPQKQLEQTRQGIEQGLAILRETDSMQRQAEELLLKREKHQRETDGASRRVGDLELVMIQIQNEWKEALYAWNGQNRELLLSKEQLKEMALFAQDYNETSDFAGVRQIAADEWIAKKGVLESGLGQKRERSKQLVEEYEEQKRQREEWENQKEPEPFRSEAVLENRRRLREKKIPYQEFYKAIEFDQELDMEARNHLEEALLSMGILDALLVEEQYKEQALAMDPGCCDRYLFLQKQCSGKSLLDVLELNDTADTVFLNQKLTGILSSIAYDVQGATSIARDGTYQIGVLSGTITRNYEAGFLGAQAREQNRRAKIAACEKAMAEALAELEGLKREIEEWSRRKEQLGKEYDDLPKDEDLREALRMLTAAKRTEEQMKEEGLRMEVQLREITEKLRKRKTEALKIAEKLYLTCSYPVFLRADEAVRSYGWKFSQLKNGHELYLQMAYHLRELTERLEDLDADMDQIRYDIGTAENTLKKERAEYQSVQEQLKLTDYDQMKERLDACIQWLSDYPKNLQVCVEEKAQKEEQIRMLRQQQEGAAEKIQECQRKEEYLAVCCRSEMGLGYVKLPEKIFREKENAGEIRDFLALDCKGLVKNTVVTDLNAVFYDNRSALNEYHLTLTELFTEEEQKASEDFKVSRLDILARYQGVEIPFWKLSDQLGEEIEQLQGLIRSSERELFEDILANNISHRMRGKINASNAWVEKMNKLMGAMNTSSGLKLNLRWRSKTAESEGQLDTRELVELLKKDSRAMQVKEAERLALHFRSKVEEARRFAKDSGGNISFYQVMKDTLDYRKWFEFQLFYQKNGETRKELTNSVFGTFSGGEKAMSMYVPLFSAVVAKYQGGRLDAPRLISLDEAFAGVDNKNIRDMFRLMTEFEFDFLINSQVLWGDCDTLDALAIYQLLRPENAKFVTVMPYLWNGKAKEMLEDENEMEQRAGELSGT